MRWYAAGIAAGSIVVIAIAGVRMILLWLILTPLIGGVLAWLGERWNDAWPRWISLAVLAIDLALVLALWADALRRCRVTATGHGLPRSIGPGFRNSASGSILAWMA